MSVEEGDERMNSIEVEMIASGDLSAGKFCEVESERLTGRHK